tara:strand:- start:993 stop:1151 length:159 start_codon:yes stop_codon:yes gene_type:complete
MFGLDASDIGLKNLLRMKAPNGKAIPMRVIKATARYASGTLASVATQSPREN